MKADVRFFILFASFSRRIFISNLLSETVYLFNLLIIHLLDEYQEVIRGAKRVLLFVRH